MTIEELDKLQAAAPMDGHPLDVKFMGAVFDAYPAIRSALLAARAWLKLSDAVDESLGLGVSFQEIVQAREALRAKLKEIGL